MIEILSASLLAWFLAIVCSNIVFTFVNSKRASGVTTFLASGVVAYSTVTGLWALAIVTLAPIWVSIILMLVFSTVIGGISNALARRGYLGKQVKWMVELMAEDDRQYEAAKTLMSKERMSEIAEVSSDKDDFKENVIEASGINDIEEKDVQEALNARQ